MVKVQVRSQEYYMDGILKKNLDDIKGLIKKDWDYFYVVDGKEGSGKSVFALQLAYYLTDGKFSLDNVCFSPQQFKDAVVNAEKYDCIVFDEAFRGWSSRSAMSQTNKSLVSLAMECRQKNLFIICVLPSVWELDKYIALYRCKGLLHVYTSPSKERGFFRFMSEKDIIFMLRNDKKYKYTYPNKGAFFGRFTNYYSVDEDAYKAKKLNSLGAYAYKEKPIGVREQKLRDKLALLIQYLKETMTYEEIGNILGLNAANTRDYNLFHMEKND